MKAIQRGRSQRFGVGLFVVVVSAVLGLPVWGYPVGSLIAWIPGLLTATLFGVVLHWVVGRMAAAIGGHRLATRLPRGLHWIGATLLVFVLANDLGNVLIAWIPRAGWLLLTLLAIASLSVLFSWIARGIDRTGGDQTVGGGNLPAKTA